MSDSDELIELEQSMLLPEVRHHRERMDALLAEDFVEFGASGHIYDKQQIVAALEAEQLLEIHAGDFAVRWLNKGAALLTYRSFHQHADGRQTRAALRCSVWMERDGAWQLVFHQGTLEA